MAKKQRPSFQKRQKEMARQQKQKEKEARRVERKQQREAGILPEDNLEVLDGPVDPYAGEEHEPAAGADSGSDARD
jgi:hypothetical protein